jgi:Ricin-type beta-trefoil lectin domain-like
LTKPWRGAAQNWTFPGNGTIGLNGKCMDITGAGTANGVLVELWTCNGGGNQQWRVP